MIELLVTAGAVLFVAILAAAIAAIANRKWPKRTPMQVASSTVFALVIGFFILTVGWMFWFMSTPCPEGSPCDAGAMAAAGAIMFGALLLIASVLIGTPVAYFTVRAIRGR